MSNVLEIQLEYNGKENRFSIDIDKIDYEEFMNNVRMVINENEPIKLMTINTKESYQILTMNTYDSIIHEKIEGDLLSLFVTKEEENETNEFNNNYKNDVNDDDIEMEDDNIDDDMKEDSFSEEIENEKKNNKKGRKSNLHKEQISNNREVVNEDNKDLLNKDNQIKHGDNTVMTSIQIENSNKEPVLINEHKEIELNLQEEQKTEINEQLMIQNEKKKLSSVSQLKNDDHIIKPLSPVNNNIKLPDLNNKQHIIKPSSSKLQSFSNEQCSICKCPLQYVKYICCICESLKMCNNCEEFHPHPSFKYKTHFLSTLDDTYNFIESRQDIKEPLAISMIFKKEHEIEIVLPHNQITIRPNEGITVPVTLHNRSNIDIKGDELILLIRNNKRLHFSYDIQKLYLLRNSSYIILLKVISEYDLGTYDIDMELYSNVLNLKDCKAKTARMTIEVNEDYQEEQLNSMFDNDLKMLKKENKEMINHIIKEKISIKAPEEIAQILMKYNWDLEKAKSELV